MMLNLFSFIKWMELLFGFMLFFFVIVCENKKLKEVNLSDKFQRHIVSNFKAIIFISFK